MDVYIIFIIPLFLERLKNNFLVKLTSLLWTKWKEAFLDVLPVILVVSFFQLIVLNQPFPDLGNVLVGGFLVVTGLMLFVKGLEIGLFPLGELMANALARKGSVFWLLTFSFALGFSTTIAEPALIAITHEFATMSAQSQYIGQDEQSISSFAFGLRMTVALSVGCSIVLGVFRILKGWPVYYLIMGGYVIVLVISIFAPKEIIGLAFDAGGVTTSTITVPLVTALGVGLATIIKGRSPLKDGFGLIAFASLFPIIFVMIYGMIIFNIL